MREASLIFLENFTIKDQRFQSLSWLIIQVSNFCLPQTTIDKWIFCYISDSIVKICANVWNILYLSFFGKPYTTSGGNYSPPFRIWWPQELLHSLLLSMNTMNIDLPKDQQSALEKPTMTNNENCGIPSVKSTCTLGERNSNEVNRWFLLPMKKEEELIKFPHILTLSSQLALRISCDVV